jgi:hypothetical protein
MICFSASLAAAETSTAVSRQLPPIKRGPRDIDAPTKEGNCTMAMRPAAGARTMATNLNAELHLCHCGIIVFM